MYQGPTFIRGWCFFHFSLPKCGVYWRVVFKRGNTVIKNSLPLVQHYHYMTVVSGIDKNCGILGIVFVLSDIPLCEISDCPVCQFSRKFFQSSVNGPYHLLGHTMSRRESNSNRLPKIGSQLFVAKSIRFNYL